MVLGRMRSGIYDDVFFFSSGSRSLFKRVKVMEGVEYLCRASFLLGIFCTRNTTRESRAM